MSMTSHSKMLSATPQLIPGISLSDCICLSCRASRPPAAEVAMMERADIKRVGRPGGEWRGEWNQGVEGNGGRLKSAEAGEWGEGNAGAESFGSHGRLTQSRQGCADWKERSRLKGSEG